MPTSPLANPQGLVFGPDGNLYVADVTTGTVHRFDGTTGTFIDEFVPLGAPIGNPTGVTFGPDSNFYVTSGTGVDQFNGSTGVYQSNFVPIPVNLVNPQYLIFGPADAAVPEPATIGLIGSALGVIGFARWRRRGTQA
jgi:DNA-binding beta-propeller fold protein YncE